MATLKPIPRAISTHYHLTRKSANTKTGPIPVSTTSEITCPPSCPLSRAAAELRRRQGIESDEKAPCYAAAGYHLNLHWSKVTAGTRGVDLAGFCEQVKALPAGQLWRHNQAGDLPGIGDEIDAADLAAITRANRGRRGFTYTHKPVFGRHGAANLAAIKAANRDGFTVNLSADDMIEADKMAALGLPVCVLLPANAPRKIKTPADRPVIPCPAQVRENMDCERCGNGSPLCARADRVFLVGFLSHGAGKAAADAIARGSVQKAAA